jgi:hypothetical protein
VHHPFAASPGSPCGHTRRIAQCGLSSNHCGAAQPGHSHAHRLGWRPAAGAPTPIAAVSNQHQEPGRGCSRQRHKCRRRSRSRARHQRRPPQPPAMTRRQRQQHQRPAMMNASAHRLPPHDGFAVTGRRQSQPQRALQLCSLVRRDGRRLEHCVHTVTPDKTVEHGRRLRDAVMALESRHCSSASTW